MITKRLLGFTALLVLIGCIPSAFCLAASGAGAVQYQAIDLGPIGSFGFDFEINSSGVIVGPVGYSQPGSYGPRASIWYPDGTRYDLGALWDTTDTATYAINDAGQIALYVHGQAYKWSESTGPVYLGALPTAGKSCPQSINNLGDVAGWAYVSGGQEHGVVWRADGSIVDLGLGSASDINDLSQTVGVSVYDRWYQHGVVWDSDGAVASVIGDVRPLGINNAGQVIGYQWNDDQLSGFVWSGSTGIADLPLLPDATESRLISDAHGINESGQIVGYSVDAFGRRRAVLWDSQLNVTDLTALSGYSQGEAYAINDLGWVVGYSSNVVDGGGDDHLTLWKPVPEPSSLLALGSGLLALGGLIRRRR